MLHHLKLASIQALHRLYKEQNATVQTQLWLFAYKTTDSYPKQAVYKCKNICPRALFQLGVILRLFRIKLSTSFTSEAKRLLATTTFFTQKVEGITITGRIFAILIMGWISFKWRMYYIMISVRIRNLPTFMMWSRNFSCI